MVHLPHFHESDSHKHKKEYVIGKRLGEGGYSQVYFAEDLVRQRQVAIKVAPKKLVRHVDAQIFIMNLLSQKLIHPHIIRLYEWWESTHNYYMVFELAHGGELFDRLVERGSLPETEVRLVVLAVLDALKYLHAQSICHRDIKPENVLLKHPWSADDHIDEKIGAPLVLSDFGMSIQLASPDEKRYDGVGSPVYAAPEVYGNDGYNTSADMWSVGIMTFALLSGHYPFNSVSLPDVLEEARRENITFPDEAWSEISQEVKDFILNLLQVDPSARPTAAEALQHPWLFKRQRALSNLSASPGGKTRVERQSTLVSQQQHEPSQVHAKV